MDIFEDIVVGGVGLIIEWCDKIERFVCMGNNWYESYWSVFLWFCELYYCVVCFVNGGVF